MAIAFDAVSESHSDTFGSSFEASFSWTHTPVGTPKGILIFTFVNANADDATSVTYGGVTVNAVSGGRTSTSNSGGGGGQPGDCKAWFLGSGIPTGSQTVVVNRTNNGNPIYAVAISVTSGADSAVHEAGIVLINSDGSSLSEQSITDGSPGINSLRFAAVNAGFPYWNKDPDAGFLSDNVLPGNNSIWINNTTLFTGENAIGIMDYGTRGCGVVRESAAGQGSRSVGFSASSTAFPPPSYGRAVVYLAVKEVTATTATIKDMIGCGIIPFPR